MNHIIEVKNVYKSFKNIEVLHDVSLQVDAGSICGIIGRNGSGKTVLFKCICGFLQTDRGEIQIEGKAVGKDNHHRITRIFEALQRLQKPGIFNGTER